MCGLSGIISTNPSLSLEKLRAGLTCLRHRGPEKENVWQSEDGSTALGHRRLSIIDLSEAAGQPMHYRNRYVIVHNGELYNYIEIRHELSRLGHSFATASDTEVIVAAFDAWGSNCLTRFDGMFAFAIWDRQEKRLFAARDRFGEKPFFFFRDDEQLVFTSEQKTLWSLGIEKKVNPRLLYNFLTIDYTSNPADPGETFYENIFKLPAASFLTYTATTGELAIEKYWQLHPENRAAAPEKDVIEEFGSLLKESIRSRLRSDVPIGTSLSGGLDSSSIVAFCADIPSDQYRHECITATFPGFGKNEEEFAATVATKYGLTHHRVTIRDEDVVGLMEKLMHHQEEPVRSASPLAQFAVYKAAKEHGITVMLDGQGADEILAGYHHYYKWYWAELYRSGRLKKSSELRAARVHGIQTPFGLQNRGAALFPELASALWQSRKAQKAFRHPDLHPDFAFANKRELYYSLPEPGLNGALYFNTFVNGLEDLLRLADRNSMAHGVEVRLPFLYLPLVEFLFSLPPEYKIREGWTKWILRKAVDEKLPPGIVWRKDKTAFEPPQKQWMERADVKEAIRNGKKKLIDNGILRADVLKKEKPHEAYAADGSDWKYWSASFLFS